MVSVGVVYERVEGVGDAVGDVLWWQEGVGQVPREVVAKFDGLMGFFGCLEGAILSFISL